MSWLISKVLMNSLSLLGKRNGMSMEQNEIALFVQRRLLPATRVLTKSSALTPAVGSAKQKAPKKIALFVRLLSLRPDRLMFAAQGSADMLIAFQGGLQNQWLRLEKSWLSFVARVLRDALETNLITPAVCLDTPLMSFGCIWNRIFSQA